MTEFEPQTVLLCFIQCATAAAQTNTYEKKYLRGIRTLGPKAQSLQRNTEDRKMEKDGLAF